MAIYRGSGSASSTSDQATIDEVTQQATNAASSATSAASSASSAASSASSASTSANTATTQASNASTSATSAASSASAASTSATNAATSATNAATSETNAANSATSASSAQTAAESAKVSAETAQTNAASSASTASTAATTATTKASEASASATTASTAATTASTAATAAESARDSTLAAFDSFDDRYLGSKTSDPTLDNDGNALVGGALYFNSVDEVMKVYTGTQWVAAYADVSGALLAVNNLSDLNNASSARTNLGLGTAATTASTDYATAAQGTLAASAVQPGDLATVATTGTYSDLTGSPTTVSSFTNDAGYSTTTGTVTSVAATVPLGLTVTGSPITSTGTLAVAYDTGYAIPTTAKQTQWDTAYGWGDHSTAGYLTSYTETDPVYTASSWYTTTNNSTNWNTAYGWGDHSTQNYATTTGDTMTGALNFGDNVKAQFGASNDLQISHNGSHSIIQDVGTGNLYISGTELAFVNGDFSQTYALFNSGGGANLYHNNLSKLSTTSDGVDITGEIYAYRGRGATQTSSIGAGSYQLQLNNYTNFVWTISGAITLTNPGTEAVGQSGVLVFIHSGGGQTVSIGTDFETVGGAGLTLSGTAGATDIVPYFVAATNRIILGQPLLAVS